MIEKIFINDETIKDYYQELIPAYQEAFSGDPWYEKSKCRDSLVRCVGGLSAVAVGSLCAICNLCPVEQAYENDELIQKFNAITDFKKTIWYLEKEASHIALAVIAWLGDAQTIMRERYSAVPEMEGWLEDTMQGSAVIWLDEVFAQKSVRQSGNLKNFRSMCDGFSNMLSNNVLAFRTINPALTRAAQRDYAEQVTVYKRNTAVPDRRDLVVICNKGENL